MSGVNGEKLSSFRTSREDHKIKNLFILLQEEKAVVNGILLSVAT